MKKQKPPLRPASYVIFSKKLPLRVRVRDFILTILIWSMYIYFMKDFAIFVHDAAIWIYHGYDDPAQYPGLKILPDIVAFIKITVVLVCLLIGWSYYNLIRYGRKKRRQPTPPMTIKQIAADYKLDPHDLESWQNTRVLTMCLDKKGRLDRVVKK